jgi:hypothetical protein
VNDGQHLMLDNEWVAEIARDVMLGNTHAEGLEHFELWDRLVSARDKMKKADILTISWTPVHVSEEAVRGGKVTSVQRELNDGADKRAKKCSNAHPEGPQG